MCRAGPGRRTFRQPSRLIYLVEPICFLARIYNSGSDSTLALALGPFRGRWQSFIEGTGMEFRMRRGGIQLRRSLAESAAN